LNHRNTSFEELEGSLSERTSRRQQGVSLPQGCGLITPAQPESEIQFCLQFGQLGQRPNAPNRCISTSRYQSVPVGTRWHPS